MANLFVFLFLISILVLIIGLINPSIFNRFLKGKVLGRSSILKIFGSLSIVSLILIGVFSEPVETKQNNKTADNNFKQSPIFINNDVATKTTELNKTEPDNNLKLYNVVQVVDGDTVKVDLDGKTETLRLIGIDTPETVDPRKVVQCFGLEASNKAKELLTGKRVRLKADTTQGERDKYNRLLRYVFLEDGTFFNKLMIAEGYAHEYTYQSNPYFYQLDFKAAEDNAREQGLGLWNVNTCNGDTSKSSDSSNNEVNITQEQNTNTVDSLSPQVKKSTSDICHEKGTTYYNRTTNFEPFNSIEECLASGGRLPK